LAQTAQQEEDETGGEEKWKCAACSMMNARQTAQCEVCELTFEATQIVVRINESQDSGLMVFSQAVQSLEDAKRALEKVESEVRQAQLHMDTVVAAFALVQQCYVPPTQQDLLFPPARPTTPTPAETPAASPARPTTPTPAETPAASPATPPQEDPKKPDLQEITKQVVEMGYSPGPEFEKMVADIYKQAEFSYDESIGLGGVLDEINQADNNMEAKRQKQSRLTFKAHVGQGGRRKQDSRIRQGGGNKGPGASKKSEPEENMGAEAESEEKVPMNCEHAGTEHNSKGAETDGQAEHDEVAHDDDADFQKTRPRNQRTKVKNNKKSGKRPGKRPVPDDLQTKKRSQLQSEKQPEEKKEHLDDSRSTSDSSEGLTKQEKEWKSAYGETWRLQMAQKKDEEIKRKYPSKKNAEDQITLMGVLAEDPDFSAMVRELLEYQRNEWQQNKLENDTTIIEEKEKLVQKQGLDKDSPQKKRRK
jgi:hypothetical protein